MIFRGSEGIVMEAIPFFCFFCNFLYFFFIYKIKGSVEKGGGFIEANAL